MRKNILVAAAVLLAAAGGVLAWLRPGSGGARDDLLHVDEQEFEVTELADAGVVQSALRATRDILKGRPHADTLAGYAGRRVFVCAYGIERRAVCGTGRGDTLGASVAAAATDLHRRASSFEKATLKIDFVVDHARVRWPAPGFDHHIGVYGLLVDHAGQQSWLLPSELLELPVWMVPGDDQDPVLDEERLRKALQQRNPQMAQLPLDFSFERFRTASWVERPDEAPLRIYRTHAWEQPELDAELLLERAFMAADHLANLVGTTGQMRYLYDPTRNRNLMGDNRLRHAGSTWSLVQAWSRTRHEPWLAAAEAAIEEILRQSVLQERSGPHGGGMTRWLADTSRIKLGGAGLALLALSEYTAATGDDRYLEQARQFALYIVSAQKESGEFVYFGNMNPEKPPYDQVSSYYPGEAILGLMRLHSIDPDPLWLETARRGAMWLIEDRDAGKPLSGLQNDHWLMMALSRLYAETREPVWLEHSLRLAEAVKLQARRHDEHARYHRDYRGGFYEPPRSTPAAVRAEGLVAVLDTCALAQAPCDGVREVLEATVRHQLQSQYTPDLLWWMRAPERAVGAFHGGIVDLTIRNDYVQHNLSALLGLERHMRRDQGERLPGAPEQTRAELQAFPGLTPERLAELRRPLFEVRGATSWELATQDPAEDQATLQPDAEARVAH